MYEIGPFRLNPQAGILSQDDRPVPLGPRAVAVLKTLVENANEHVPKRRLLDTVWPGLVVEESNLAVQISAIRRALAAAPGGEHWVETLARRGYRFVGPVCKLPAAGLAQPLARTNLPAAASSFVGREREIEDVRRLLADHRLLTLVGSGGIGKTRLAQRVASGLLERYADGVWFVDLAPLADGARIASAVAETMHVPLPSGKPAFEAISSRLRDRTLLLVLDNCEHVLDGCAAFAAALLGAAAQVSILATSREALRVGGEQVFPLRPLSLPDARMELPVILSSEAVRLFLDRAREQMPDLEVSPGRARTIARLCIHLDGIPLALELAAARVRSLTIEQIHERVGDRFRLLTTGSRVSAPRHQTLRAAMDWSFDLLEGRERAVLRRCAIFAGGFTLESAAAVVSDEEIDPAAVGDIVQRLVSRSLVVAETGEARSRYRLLETTRVFALEKLEQARELESLQRRHARHFRELFARAPDDCMRRSDADLRSAYLPEIENVRNALDWALGRGNEPGLAIGLAGGTSWIWTVRVLFNEGLARLEAAAGRIGASTPALDEAELLFAIGLLHAGKPARQIAHWERAIALFRGLGKPGALGLALARQSRVLAQMGRLDEAARLLDEARPFIEEDGGRKLLGSYHSEVAFLRQMSGELEQARAHFETSLRHFLAAGAENMANQLRGTLADTMWALGDLDGAIAVARDAITAWRKGPWRTVFGYDLINLAGIHIERGELAEALEAARSPEGLAFARDRGVLWMFMDHFALCAALGGRMQDAARLEGYADHGHAANGSLRQPNEARAQARVRSLLRERLPAAALESLMAEGAQLGADEACRLALGLRP